MMWDHVHVRDGRPNRIKRKTTLMKSGSLSSGLTNAEESLESLSGAMVWTPIFSRNFGVINTLMIGVDGQIPKALHDALEEEKNKIEEELWDLKFKYEEEQRKARSLS